MTINTPNIEVSKQYITASQLLRDSFDLAMQVYDSGYRPDYIIGVWRGGAPVGIAVQELLQKLGVNADHIAIRTSSYTGSQRNNHVQVHGLKYIIRQAESTDQLLIVDDVHDTGLSVAQVIEDLRVACKKNFPDVRIATPYFKPDNNKTGQEPHYYVHRTDSWLVFPHEVCDLTDEEIATNKPELAHLLDRIIQARS